MTQRAMAPHPPQPRLPRRRLHRFSALSHARQHPALPRPFFSMAPRSLRSSQPRRSRDSKAQEIQWLGTPCLSSKGQGILLPGAEVAKQRCLESRLKRCQTPGAPKGTRRASVFRLDALTTPRPRRPAIDRLRWNAPQRPAPSLAVPGEFLVAAVTIRAWAVRSSCRSQPQPAGTARMSATPWWTPPLSSPKCSLKHADRVAGHYAQGRDHT